MDITQRNIIFSRLTSGKPITSWEAFEEYGITRLSAIIYDLREKGLDIQDTWVYRVNRYGNMVKFKQYFLVKGKK